LQTRQAVLEIAFSPKDDGVAAATKLVGDLQIGRLILRCQAQDQPTTEAQRLRRGMSSGKNLQTP
jgi:hypothetical protein